MYFIIATMALGYVGAAAAATAPRLETNPAPNGKFARKYNADDYFGCVVCLQYDETDYDGTDAFQEYLAEELADQDAGNLPCNTSLDSVEVYRWGTSSRPDDDGVYYNCNASGWTRGNLLSDGTYNYNNGTILNGHNCRYIGDAGKYYSCESCASALCNDGYYGDPTGCEITEYDCNKCPDSTNKKAIGGSGSFYTCTTILQSGQSTAGPNRTISGCKIPQLTGGSGGAYCNDNGFFIWDSACSYAG